MNADTITAIKKALEDVTLLPWELQLDDSVDKPVVAVLGKWAMCSDAVTEDGYTALAEYVGTVAPMRIVELLSTLESLQRDNESLRIDASNHAADAETVRRERDAADTRESNLRALIKRNWTGRCWRPVGDNDVLEILAALSSTGDTHGN